MSARTKLARLTCQQKTLYGRLQALDDLIAITAARLAALDSPVKLMSAVDRVSMDVLRADLDKFKQQAQAVRKQLRTYQRAKESEDL